MPRDAVCVVPIAMAINRLCALDSCRLLPGPAVQGWHAWVGLKAGWGRSRLGSELAVTGGIVAERGDGDVPHGRGARAIEKSGKRLRRQER